MGKACTGRRATLRRGIRGLALGFALSPAGLMAQQQQDLNIEQLPPEPEVGEDRPLEPEVTIIRRDREVIQEYRVNGRLTAVRIQPSKGPPYYLLDVDGDGQLDQRVDDLSDDILPPGWVIFRW
jgi:hypothetical protein